MVAMHTRVTVRVAVQSPRRLLRDTLAACLAVRPDVAVVGRVAESDAVLALLRRKKCDHAREARRERGGLTDREHEIVVLTGSGHSVTEIAALLGISPLTVENLKRRIYAKLEVSSGAHAVARAASLGMLERKTPVAAPRRRTTEGGSGVLGVVAGRPGPVLDQVVTVLLGSKLP